MELYIAIQGVAAFRADWNKIRASLSSKEIDYKIILITSESTLKAIESRSQLPCFDKIITFPKIDHTIDLAESISLLKNEFSVDFRHMRLIIQDEFLLLKVAELRDKFSIPGDKIQQIEPSINKITMKKTVSQLGIKIPKFTRFDKAQYLNNSVKYLNELKDEMTFPIFTKPVDGAASINTCILYSEYDLIEWAKKSLYKDIEFELDEYIEGILFHCDSVIKDKKIMISQVLRYSCPNFEYTKGKPLGSILVEDNLSFRLNDFSKNILEGMLLNDKLPENTVTHLEVFYRPHKDDFIFLEINARAPGGVVSKGFEKRWGQHLEEVHLGLQLGLAPILYKQPALYFAWLYFPIKSGIVAKKNLPSIKSDHELDFKLKPGDSTQKSKDVMNYACNILLTNNSLETLQKDFDYLVNSYQPYFYDYSSEKA